ncbi:MAG: phospholipase A [Desulfatibacillum sp.]|nr:phospholipase A [Desulfatibacillum sp.]
MMKMKKISLVRLAFFAIALLCVTSPAWGGTSAQNLDFVITPPKGGAASGTATQFEVYVHNPGDNEASLEIFPVLEVRLGDWPKAKTLQAKLDDPLENSTVPIPGKGYIKLKYSVDIPQDLMGVTTLAVEGFKAAPVMFLVEKSLPDTAKLFSANLPKAELEQGDVSGEEEASDENISVESLFALYQPYLTNLAPYEPMYFLAGADPKDSKFQFSFRYRFFKPEEEFVKKHPWIAGLHFAYTQTSFWDLESESAPFKDTSYKPEFFYTSGNLKTRPAWMHGLFLQTGFQHESNGRDGEFSRSTNFLYMRPGFVAYHKRTKLGFSVSSKIWTYINNEDETNPDLASYRGYFNLDVKMGKADSLVLGANFSCADEGASIQADLTYPLHNLIWKHLNLCLQVQYVNALAESLLNYKERTEAVRIGFAMVR